MLDFSENSNPRGNFLITSQNPPLVVSMTHVETISVLLVCLYIYNGVHLYITQGQTDNQL